ncbi:uncharacterized protein LOC142761280 [Rhinoderma darwinii]|uniref:uncharacterized protein LOC142761280 n=1 Tax=Rhinoderma darwinii TaxID=43563 RepID=UPI003F66A001
MEQAAKSLLVTGKSILLSVQKLSIQPVIRKHQEELVIGAQNILMGTLKMLQLEDDAGVRKILQAADWLLECLTYLQKAESTSQLQSNFWEFSEALLLLNSLTENRIFDLKDSLHQKHLSQKLQILRKCVPMLYTATQSSIKHPYNDQIIDSKLYIFDQTSKTVQDLKQLLNTDPDRHDGKKQGSFARKLYNLLHILTDPKPTELHNSDFDFLVGAMIFYCMYVADCSRPNIKLQLVKHCQKLLEQRNRLCDHLKKLQESPCGNHFDLEKLCAPMRIQLNHINENLISSIFYQILDAFNVKDPLKRLLSSALKMNKKASFQSEHLFASKALQPLLQAFQNHTDQLLTISSLVLAQCSQEQIMDEIQNSVDYLCRVRDEVVVLVLDTNKAYYECKMFEKAQSIYQKWIQATESLIMSLDGILTVYQFLELSIREVEENKYRCVKLLRSQEPDIFQHHAADLCDLAERVAQVVTRHVDQSKSPIFRNGLRVLVRQLETSVLETRAAMIKCVEKISCFSSQNNFLEKVNYLFESIHNVQDGVTGSKHPDLLSPLRNEGGPVSHKVMTIDLNESEESKGDNGKNHREQHKTCLSYEGYLSKPVILPNTGKMLRNSANAESLIPVADFQPLICDLLVSIRKQNTKEIYACSSLLHDICSIYLEVANDTLLHENIIEKGEPMYKNTEALILSLVQFNNKENSEPALGMGPLIKTATLLSHNVEEMKAYLISLVNCWYNFSYHLFCHSKNTVCATTNVDLFNRLMQCFARIVQSIREHLLDNNDDELEFRELSGKQEYLVKIHVKLSKCQATANRLLTEALCCEMQSKNHKLEYVCILWAVSAQQLSRSLDEFIGINNLLFTGPNNWTQLNISESKILALCEASLWLQEAAVLSIHNFSDENEQKRVMLLKEEIGSLTEVLLKLREDLNTPSPPDMSFNIDYILLQMELISKTKLLMNHIKKLHRGNQTLIQRIHSDISSCSSSDRSLAIRSCENNAKSLVDIVTLVKETLKCSLCVKNKEEILLSVDHLYSLTNDIAARSRLFMENLHELDLFILEALFLNWSAKADQFILLLHSDTQLDVSLLKFITQCLRSGERTETTMTDAAVHENVTSKVSSQLKNIDVTEQRESEEYKQKNSNPIEQDTNNGDSGAAVYKQIASCSDEQSEINSSDKVNSENGLISREQNAVDGTQQKKLSNGQTSTVRRSIKVVRPNRGRPANNVHNKNFTEKHCKTLGGTLQKTISTESEDSPLQVNIKKTNSEEKRLYIESGVGKCLVNQESPILSLDVTATGVKKDKTNQETRNLKTHTLLTVVKNRASHRELMLHKTHKVLTAIQKETPNQKSMNEKKCTEKLQETTYKETKDQQTNIDRMIQNDGTSQEPKKIDPLHIGVQNKITNHKTCILVTGSMAGPGDQVDVENLVTSTTPKKEPNFSIPEQQINYPQELTNEKIQLDHKGGQTHIVKQRSTNVKAYTAPTNPQKETLNKQKVTLNDKGQQKTDKEHPKPETKNKHLISNKSEESRHNDTQPKTRLKKEHKTCPISQPGLNILKMDYKMPLAVSRKSLSSTTVIVEHAKVNCTLLEDVRNVHWHSHKFAKCLLAEEVETWEV